MTATAMQQAAIKRIIDNAAITVGLPNKNPGDMPRYVIQIGPGTNTTVNLCGETQRLQEIIVLVQTRSEDYATDSDTHVQSLLDMFPALETFEGVQVTAMPNQRPPLVDGDIYTVPVAIPLRKYI